MADSSAMEKKPSASLVTDVLLKSGRLEKEDINSCVKKTLQKAEEVKASFIFCLRGINFTLNGRVNENASNVASKV